MLDRSIKFRIGTREFTPLMIMKSDCMMLNFLSFLGIVIDEDKSLLCLCLYITEASDAQGAMV